jgi:arabinan endo-1,5-alpha-L-arabinosidase
MHLNRNQTHCVWLFLFLSSLAHLDCFAQLTNSAGKGLHLHDPSTIARDRNQWWLFSTGRGISSFHSTNLLDWAAGPPIFTNAPNWALEAVPDNRRMYYWAPDVIKVKDRFLLYYSVSTFGKNRSVIGLASNPTLDPAASDFNWRDDGPVISSDRTNNFNAIDPALVKDQDGHLWMAFGSFWSGIKIIELDPTTGKRVAPDSPISSLARSQTIEAPYIYFHDEYYYLFVNWGYCCRGTNSTYNIRVGRSQKITGPYLDQSGQDMAQGGGTLFLQTEGAAIGPGHAGILHDADHYWFSMHFYDGTDRGTSKLSIRPLVWESTGWPAIQPFP